MVVAKYLFIAANIRLGIQVLWVVYGVFVMDLLSSRWNFLNGCSLRLSLLIAIACIPASTDGLAAENGPVEQSKAAAVQVAKLETATPVEIAAPTQTKIEHISILMVGDTGFAPSRTRPLPDRVYKYGRKLTFADTTARIKADINADINFANIETVISDRGDLVPRHKKYNFVTHPNGISHLIKAGFNLFSMANNHAFDYGAQGIKESLRNLKPLESKGLLAYAGIGANRTDAGKTPVFEKKGLKVAFGAIGIGANGGGLPRATTKRPGQLSLFLKKDQQLLASNFAKSGADLRLLSVHHGPERVIRPSGYEIAMLRNLVAQTDADIMIGHHAHVSRGIEIRNGKLMVYGLGNFNHQGTANMNRKNGCLNYSLMVRAHFIRETGGKPVLAAVEALPIQSTHMQPERIRGVQGARRIAILNGLAAQLDQPKTGSAGVRFMAQDDGSGLHCTKAALRHPYTAQLCSNYSAQHLASNAQYRQAAATCGGRAPTHMIARAEPSQALRVASLVQTRSDAIKVDQAKVAPIIEKVGTLRSSINLPSAGAKHELIAKAGGRSAPDAQENAQSGAAREIKITKLERLAHNPDHWPAGMPLAWAVPENESAQDRLHRWKKKRYSVAEVEKLLRKKGLIR